MTNTPEQPSKTPEEIAAEVEAELMAWENPEPSAELPDLAKDPRLAVLSNFVQRQIER